MGEKKGNKTSNLFFLFTLHKILYIKYGIKLKI